MRPFLERLAARAKRRRLEHRSGMAALPLMRRGGNARGRMGRRPHEEEVFAEQVGQIYSLAPIGIFATLINATVVLLLMQEVLPFHLIFGWFGLILIVTLVRVGLIIAYQHAEQAESSAPRWERRYLISAVLIGAAWGSIGALPFTFSLAHQVFIVFVLGGMAAGSCSVHSKIRLGYEAFSLPAILPMTVHFLLTDDDLHRGMGLMMILYLVLLGRLARHNYRVNGDSLMLRYENEDVIQSLKEAKAELKAHHDQLEKMVEKRTADLIDANQKLKKEIETRSEIEAALRESRERLMLAERAGRVGIFDWDLVTGRVIWNEELAELFGASNSELIGKYEMWSSKVVPADLERIEEEIRTRLQNRVEELDFEYRFMRAGWEVRWMASTARVSYAADGTPLRMIGTNLDITEMKETQEKLLASKEAAEAASQAKSEFLANMSHEMRTPLAGVLGMVKLVLDMEIGDEERRLLEMARRSADSLLRIIADLLDFARLEAGIMKFERKPFVVAEVIRSATEVVSFSAMERGLALTWKAEGDLPETVVGDEGRLRQVLVNLVGNAVKFTDEGGIEITAAPIPPRDGEEEPSLLFSVKDTGVGIPPDQLEKIFGKFTQIDSSLTRKYGGTGLGLALSRQIVEKMGGRIWAESTVGLGSTFHFTVPWVAAFKR